MTNGWQEVPLGKVLKRADRYEQKDELQTYHFAGTYSFARGIFSGEVKEGSTFRLDKVQRIKKGDFIYCKIMAWEGAFGIAPEKVDEHVMSGAFVAYEVDQNQIDPKFLDYYFKQEPVWKSIGSQSTGTNVRRRSLHPNQFEKATIPLPPLSEQRRIVERVESLARRVNEAQRLREEAGEEAELLAFSTARKIISELDYKIIELGELVDESRNGIQTGPFGAQLGSSDFTETGHPVITIGNVQYSGLETAKLKFVSKEKAKQLFRFLVQEGDILFARMGTVGRCCVVPKEAAGWIFNYHLIRVALDKSKVEPRFIHWLIRASQDIENKLDEKIRGATREGVNSKIVAALPCRVPPLDEQRRIVAYLDGLQAKVNALRELQSKSGEELSALMPSILDKAFRGEL